MLDGKRVMYYNHKGERHPRGTLELNAGSKLKKILTKDHAFHVVSDKQVGGPGRPCLLFSLFVLTGLDLNKQERLFLLVRISWSLSCIVATASCARSGNACQVPTAVVFFCIFDLIVVRGAHYRQVCRS